MLKNFLCPNCKKENPPQNKNCFYCGTPLGVMGAYNSFCPNGHRRVPNDRFCGECGCPLPPICPNCGRSIDTYSRYCPGCSYFCGGGREGL